MENNLSYKFFKIIYITKKIYLNMPKKYLNKTMTLEE